MHVSSHVVEGVRRALAVGALVGGFVAACLGLATDQALAAYTAQAQADTLKITGDGASDKPALRLQPGAPGTLQVDVGANGSTDFSFDRTTFTRIAVAAGGGADEVTIDQSGGTFTDEIISIDGGDGADTLRGGSGQEVFDGGAGNDTIDGNQGNDVAFMGANNDHFVWDPGDGSDTIEGQDGVDVLDFNGSAGNETFEVSANGGRVRFTRNIANIVMDLDDVEQLALRALGGADNITTGDMSGTDLTLANIDLNQAAGGGDAQPDTVTAIGTNAVDQVAASSAAGVLHVTGLAAQTQVTGSEADRDAVQLNTLAGADIATSGVGVAGPSVVRVDGGAHNDRATFTGSTAADPIALTANGTAVRTSAPGIAPFETTAVEDLLVQTGAGADSTTAAGNLAPLTRLTIDGGDGADVLAGGNGADVILGGAGNDTIDGNQGNDVAFMGANNDHFVWDPGDGSDTIEGQDGVDVLDFNGSAGNETFEVSANGGRVRFTRNIANIVMDLDDVEQLALRALGGADNITTGDMSGTDLTLANIDLNQAAGGGDAQPDTVTAIGTNAPDVVKVTRSGAQVRTTGLATQTRIVGSEAANDTLRVSTLGGNDAVTVAPTVRELIQTVVDLGADE